MPPSPRAPRALRAVLPVSFVLVAACAGGGGSGGGAGAAAPAGSGATSTPPAPSPLAPPAPAARPDLVFGHRYWNVYRPRFLAAFYEDGRTNDRTVAGTPMFGDNTAFMSYALSTFVFEYQAAALPESLSRIHEILDAYDALDVLDGDPADGYMVRADRGPDYITNPWTRNNEPSGDQILATLRGLRDVVDAPTPLVHGGVDLKAQARGIAERLGLYVARVRFRLTNPAGQLVKRGDDQRWPGWAIQQGVAHITGQPIQRFQSSWDVLGLTIDPAQHEAITRQWIDGAFKFSRACVGGNRIVLSQGLFIDVHCNEFNVTLGGNAAVIAASTDPQSPRWFSKLVARGDINREGNALYAMYARYKFKDADPGLLQTCAYFLTAPPAPPEGDNLAPFGWCRGFRWYYDFSDPAVCAKDVSFATSFSGIDYMVCRAMASAYGEFPE